eukprot:4869595-Lingulodinium_polyedra.AAC.1
MPRAPLSGTDAALRRRAAGLGQRWGAARGAGTAHPPVWPRGRHGGNGNAVTGSKGGGGFLAM